MPEVKNSFSFFNKSRKQQNEKTAKREFYKFLIAGKKPAKSKKYSEKRKKPVEKTEKPMDSEKLWQIFLEQIDVMNNIDLPSCSIFDLNPSKLSWPLRLFFFTLLFQVVMTSKSSAKESESDAILKGSFKDHANAGSGYSAFQFGSAEPKETNEETQIPIYLSNPELFNLVRNVGIVFFDLEQLLKLKDMFEIKHSDSWVKLKLQEEKYLDKNFEISKEATEKIEKQIREQLACTANTDVLKKVLNNPKFSVAVLPPCFMKSNGRYKAAANMVLLKFDPDQSDGMVQAILSNELDSAAYCVENKLKNKTTTNCVIPPNAKELEKSINNGYKKIDKYKAMFEKYVVAKSSQEFPQQLEDFLNAVVSYEPFRHEMAVSIEGHHDLLSKPFVEKMSDSRLFVPKEFSPFKLHVLKEIQDLYIINYRQIDQKTMIYRYSFNKDNSNVEKAKAFFLDSEVWESKFKQSERYSGADETSERSSNIAMLPPNLQKMFFPKWCEITSEFHGLEKDAYCEKPTECSTDATMAP